MRSGIAYDLFRGEIFRVVKTKNVRLASSFSLKSRMKLKNVTHVVKQIIDYK